MSDEIGVGAPGGRTAERGADRRLGVHVSGSASAERSTVAAAPPVVAGARLARWEARRRRAGAWSLLRRAVALGFFDHLLACA